MYKISRAEKINYIFDQMAARPFLTTVLSCLLLFPIGFCQQENLFAKALTPKFLFWLAFIMIVVAALYFKHLKILSDRNLIILLMAAGLLLRFVYVLSVNSFVCQHDVGMFTGTAGGHSNYIEYWYNNGLKLPDFDVRSKWQFYHPPFHHMTMALLLKVFVRLGMEYNIACQALQILPMIYSTLCMVVIYRIFRYFKLKSSALIIAMAIICIHPTFIFMAGYFNNDTLSVLFMLLAVLFSLKWYEKPTLKYIIPIALSIGLGMMTKLSAWMVAPAIAVLFIYVFIKNFKNAFNYIVQFAVFGVISIPLGIWWQVRNLVKFQIPLNYVPELGENWDQYIGKISTSTRLFDFGNGQLHNVFLARGFEGANYFEYNPTIGLFKTAVFDENFPSNPTGFTTLVTSLLFWSSVLLAIVCFVAFIMMIVRKNSNVKGIFRAFLGLLVVVPLISYYIFCFDYPYTCTQSIRYLVIVIPMCSMGFGSLLQTDNVRKNKMIKIITYCIVCLFFIASCIVYSRIKTIIPQ